MTPMALETLAPTREDHTSDGTLSRGAPLPRASAAVVCEPYSGVVSTHTAMYLCRAK